MLLDLLHQESFDARQMPKTVYEYKRYKGTYCRSRTCGHMSIRPKSTGRYAVRSIAALQIRSYDLEVISLLLCITRDFLLLLN